MKLKLILSFIFIVFSLSATAEQSLYCPQNRAYISLGMTMEEVVAACGQPQSQLDSNKPLIMRVPVSQFIYNNQGTDQPFSNENPNNPFRYNYLFWSQLKSGSGGAQLEIDIIDNKVKLIRTNSNNNNASSICAYNLRIGDPIGKVYNACGSPSIVNNTFMIQAVQTTGKPRLWVYQLNEFQPSVTLTFANGKLQSIN